MLYFCGLQTPLLEIRVKELIRADTILVSINSVDSELGDFMEIFDYCYKSLNKK